MLVMKKWHFMATHTWVSDDFRYQALAANSQMSDIEFFESLKTESAKTMAHWIGQSDFFFAIDTQPALTLFLKR